MRTSRNANGPAAAKIVVSFYRFKIVVQDLVASVGSVGYPDIALSIDLKAVGQVELTGFPTRFLVPCLREKPAVLVKLHHAIVAVSVGNEDVALRIPGHICRAAENIF